MRVRGVVDVIYLTKPIHEMTNTMDHLCVGDQFTGLAGSFSSKSTRITSELLFMMALPEWCWTIFSSSLPTALTGRLLDSVCDSSSTCVELGTVWVTDSLRKDMNTIPFIKNREHTQLRRREIMIMYNVNRSDIQGCGCTNC